MFPSTVVIVIATTRLHRSLQYFAHSSTMYDILQSILLHAHCSLCHLSAPGSHDEKTRNSRFASRTKNPSVVRIPSNRLEVSVHTTYEGYPMSPMNHCGPIPDKPRELDIDDKVKGCDDESMTAFEKPSV